MRLWWSKVNVQHDDGDAYTVDKAKGYRSYIPQALKIPHLIETNIIANIRYLPSKGTTKLSIRGDENEILCGRGKKKKK